MRPSTLGRIMYLLGAFAVTVIDPRCGWRGGTWIPPVAAAVAAAAAAAAARRADGEGSAGVAGPADAPLVGPATPRGAAADGAPGTDTSGDRWATPAAPSTDRPRPSSLTPMCSGGRAAPGAAIPSPKPPGAATVPASDRDGADDAGIPVEADGDGEDEPLVAVAKESPLSAGPGSWSISGKWRDAISGALTAR